MDEFNLKVAAWVGVGIIWNLVLIRKGHNMGTPAAYQRGNIRFMLTALVWPITAFYFLIIEKLIINSSDLNTDAVIKDDHPFRRAVVIGIALSTLFFFGALIWYQINVVIKEKREFEEIFFHCNSTGNCSVRAYELSEIHGFIERWPNGHYTEAVRSVLGGGSLPTEILYKYGLTDENSM